MRYPPIALLTLSLLCSAGWAAATPQPQGEQENTSRSLDYQAGGDFKHEGIGRKVSAFVREVQDAFASSANPLFGAEIRGALVKLKNKIETRQKKQKHKKVVKISPVSKPKKKKGVGDPAISPLLHGNGVVPPTGPPVRTVNPMTSDIGALGGGDSTLAAMNFTSVGEGNTLLGLGGEGVPHLFDGDPLGAQGQILGYSVAADVTPAPVPEPATNGASSPADQAGTVNHMTSNDGALGLLGDSTLAAMNLVVDDGASLLSLGGEVGTYLSDGDSLGSQGQNPRYFVATNVTPAPVPEPATMLLMGTGLVGLVRLRRKSRRQKAA